MSHTATFVGLWFCVWAGWAPGKLPGKVRQMAPVKDRGMLKESRRGAVQDFHRVLTQELEASYNRCNHCPGS